MREYSAKSMGFDPSEERQRRSNLLSMALSIFGFAYDRECPIDDQEVARKYYCLGIADGYVRGYTDGINGEIIDLEKKKQEEILDVVEPNPSLKEERKNDRHMRDQQIFFQVPKPYGPINDIDTTQEGWSVARGDLHHAEWIREHHDIDHDLHFTKWCADWIEAGTGVVDIGANIGTHSIPYLRRNPSWLISVEPSPTLFECLRRNLLREIGRLASQTSVAAYCYGVGATSTVVPYHYDSDHPGTSHITNTGETPGSHSVEIHRLERFLSPIDGEKVSLLKIDVEGYEPFIIEGAMDTVLSPKHGKDRPVIVMEINNVFLARHGWNAKSLLFSMQQLNYVELGKWPPEYDKIPREELLSKPVFECCFMPG